MKHNQDAAPLFQKLVDFSKSDPISFHVPGHKNGAVFPENAREFYGKLLQLDMTELPGLDDLHAPGGVIAEAEELARDFFGTSQTYFLVGGSTVGNLAMILATCSAGDKIIVQRNCHKSIINGLELCGAEPIFIAPEYDKAASRYIAPSLDALQQALRDYPEAKAVILTYPDYFGKTYGLEQMISLVHEYNIPVLIDEAHGVHFSLGKPFPPSALTLGADAVVQSAHKSTPAMTMGSYLHLKTDRIPPARIEHYLQILQSSSPSYPLMASLDIARAYLANLTKNDIESIINSVHQTRDVFAAGNYWRLLPMAADTDPLKITLHVEHFTTGYDVANKFEQQGIYPELATYNQVLFIHGLEPFQGSNRLKKAVKEVNEQLKISSSRATMDIIDIFPNQLDKLAISYQVMNQKKTAVVPFHEAVGKISAEAIIPYPPGIPLILRGERITGEHIQMMEQLASQGAAIQQRNITNGIRVFR